VAGTASRTPEPVDLLTTAAGVVTLDQDNSVHAPGAVAVRGDRIVAVGSVEALVSRYQPTKRIDAPRCWIFPGLINTHTHLWQTLLKGLGDDMPLIEWIQALLVPTFPYLDDEACYLGAALGALEAARSGSTTTLDFMHCVPRLSVYDEIIRAFDDVGGSLVLGRGVRDRFPPDSPPPPDDLPMEQQLDHCRVLFEQYGRDRVWIAPGTTWSMTEEALRASRAMADRLGMLMTIHLNEVKFDSEDCLKRSGMRSLPFLDSLGFLGPDVLHAHCVWTDATDIGLLAERRCSVSYNPVSNMYLGSGTPPIVDLIEAGVRLSLGSDGAASNNSQDMIEALKFGALLQKVARCDPTALTAHQILRMATVGGADALHRADLGFLAPSMQADFFLFDPLRPKSVPLHEPVSTLVYTGSQHNVVTTVAAGRVILEDGRITSVDEEELLERAQKLAVGLARESGTDGLVARRGR
jgi:5-methylthioadenosine/S-adenosylhomocysteine deaminase